MPGHPSNYYSLLTHVILLYGNLDYGSQIGFFNRHKFSEPKTTRPIFKNVRLGLGQLVQLRRGELVTVGWIDKGKGEREARWEKGDSEDSADKCDMKANGG